MASNPSEQTALLSGISDMTPISDYASSSQPHSTAAAAAAAAARRGSLEDGPSHAIGFGRSMSIALSLFCLIFLHTTNMSGLAMIQGSLAKDLRSPSQTMWFTTSYLIASSSLTPLAGSLATTFSPRSVVLPSAVLFSLGSLVASQAHSFPVFMLGRVVMGFGGAGVVVMSVVFVIELAGKRRRGVMIGVVNTAYTLGVSVGAAVYGVLQPVIGWGGCQQQRSLFWLQSAVILLAGFGLYLSLPESMSSSRTEQDGKAVSLQQKLANIDYLGAVLLILTIVLFLYSLAGDIHPTPLILSLLSLLAFIAVEFNLAPNPIIPLSVLSSRGILLSCLSQLGLLTGRMSIIFYTPIFMLAVRGSSAATAGSVLIASNVALSLGGLLIGWLHIRRAGSYYLSLLVSILCLDATFYALAEMSRPATPSHVFVATVCFSGFVTGIVINYALVHILHLSHANTEYVTTSLFATFRGFGASFGTSLGGGIFYRILRSDLVRGFLALDGTSELGPARRKLVDRLLESPELVWHGGELLKLEPQERQIAVEGYADAIKGVWRAAAVLGLLVIAVQAAAGWTSPREEATRKLQHEYEHEHDA
ncbi:MFS transporter M2 [Trichoderma asperellum]|uniref:MFS transporter M2 n=1 Tax=Trichoderma asperellum TaxID=101201 RepID=A0A6V8QUU8_TRIAP|nr:MFS transporter M2 [Trichoderma asperellum]